MHGHASAECNCRAARGGRGWRHVPARAPCAPHFISLSTRNEADHMKPGKVVVAVVGITMLLGVLASSASAGRLSSTEQRIRAAWRTMNFRVGFGTIECEVTLDVTFHARTITKTTFALIGYITSATVRSCSRGGMTILTETLPWHVEYSGFVGTLPNILDIDTSVVGASLRLRESSVGATCLARSSAAAPVALSLFREAGGFSTVALISGTILCLGAISGFATVSGISSFVENGAGRIMQYTLI